VQSYILRSILIELIEGTYLGSLWLLVVAVVVAVIIMVVVVIVVIVVMVEGGLQEVRRLEGCRGCGLCPIIEIHTGGYLERLRL